MLFFAPGKTDLDEKARVLLDNVAEVYRACGTAGISIAGHSDRAGSAAHNVSLSLGRSEHVRRYLTEQGLPDERMMIYGFGEWRPLSDIADWAREEHDRRVEVRFVSPW